MTLTYDDFKTFDDKLQPGEGTYVHAVVLVRVPVSIATRKGCISSPEQLHYELAAMTWAALDSTFNATELAPEDIDIVDLQLRSPAQVPTDSPLASEHDTRIYLGLDDGDWTILPTSVQDKLRAVTYSATH